jgi:hypothetical protein
MQYRAHIWVLDMLSKLNSYYYPKIAKKAHGLILFGTMNDDDAPLDACCCFSTPS